MAQRPIEDDPRLTAYALDELEPGDRAEIEARITADPEARQFVDDVRRMAQLLTDEFAREVGPRLDEPRRQTIEDCLQPARFAMAPPLGRLRRYALAASILILASGAVTVTWMTTSSWFRPGDRLLAHSDRSPADRSPVTEKVAAPSSPIKQESEEHDRLSSAFTTVPESLSARPRASGVQDSEERESQRSFDLPAPAPIAAAEPAPLGDMAEFRSAPTGGGVGGMAGASVQPAPSAAPTNIRDQRATNAPRLKSSVRADRPEMPAEALVRRGKVELGQALNRGAALSEPVEEKLAKADRSRLGMPGQLAPPEVKRKEAIEGEQAERLDANALAGGFSPIVENPFVRVIDAPLSTFGVDVDTASYTIVRRSLLENRQLPPPDAVRIEEMLNYFTYDDAPPKDDRPFAVGVEFARCPWQADHRLVRIGLKGKAVPINLRPSSNLVFLIDVSGSMRDSDKMPWLKASLRMLVDKLEEKDRVAIVVYADKEGLVLPPTTGDRKEDILRAIDRLEAGGSTNGGAGLGLAYQVAQDNFVADGVNRIILCTDGDFNVGVATDVAGVTRFAEEKRATKVKLTVLGFGQGNLKDAQLEALADKGDGQYAYIDNLKEAHRVLVEQFSGTVQTIAKDVKVQVDFNPRFIAAYRLIGYENRILQARDFRDDTKDAGEIGAGHAVTALYELIPAGGDTKLAAADASKFVDAAKPKDDETARSQSLEVKLGYKPPDGDVSTFFEVPARDDGRDYAAASTSFQWAAAVAEFGLLLRNSAFKGQATYDAALELAQASVGDDPDAQRREFVDMIRAAKLLARPAEIGR